MKRNLKKILSCIMSMVLIITSVAITSTSAKADVSVDSMVASGFYNLALGKTATANPSRQEGSEAAITDGDLAGDHAATTFNTAGTFYQIDLGDNYDATKIEQILIKYKENNDGDIPVKGYEIQYSTNGLDFRTVKTVDGTVVKDACENNELIEIEDVSTATGAVRYLRLYYPDAYGYGIQVREIAVLDTNMDVTTVEVEKCTTTAIVTVSSPDYNTITYNITSSDPTGYRYVVALDGAKIVGNGVDAGVDYTITGVESGFHTLTVTAAYNGLTSEPIISETVTVEDISSLISSGKNISNTTVNPLASITEVSAFYTDHSYATAKVALDGKITTGEGTDKALRTASGSPQHVIVDLGDYYTPSEMDKILIGYSNGRTYAANTSVEFSLDNTTYEAVGSKTGYECKVEGSNADLNSVQVDTTEYSQKAVRFVKITLSGGASGWGYVINEIAVIANTETPTIMGSNIPEAADVIVDTENLHTVRYTIVAGENQEDSTYVVKLGTEIVNNNAVAGTEYTITDVVMGANTLTVCTVQDGWQSKGITKNITVDGYTNYINMPLNLALQSAHNNVTATCDNDNLPPNYLEGSQEISAGVIAINDGSYTNTNHHAGYLQTRPDSSEANIVYDLAHDYLPTDIYSVIGVYESNGNRPTEYDIWFSADGENYEKVFYIENAEYASMMVDYVDVSKYTQDTVRYVKYHIIDGNYSKHYKEDGSINYGSSGYHLMELAIMGSETLLPAKPTGLVVTASDYRQITVNWIDIEDPDVTYRVYDNGYPIGLPVMSGVQTVTIPISAGEHNISIAAVKGEFANASKSVSVIVEEIPTTTPETTTPEPTTTQKPTTQKPTTPTVKPTTQAPTTVAPTTAVKKPGKAVIRKTKVGKRKVSLKLKKVRGAKGYRIKYAKNRKFKKAKTKMTTSINVVIKRLGKGKKYYFKAQAYKKVNGRKVYGAWSRVKVSKKVK